MFAQRAFESTAAIVLEAKGLALDYETDGTRLRAVENIDLAIEQGERLVLLGPSGCGKSSILKAIAGFLTPAEGQILLRGRAISGPGPDRIVVFQEFDQLLPWKTVIENVAFPLQVARKLSAADARGRAAAALARVKLSSFGAAYPHTLSGGMKQRVAIARALAMEPDVLLMDEPFAALDALTRRQLQEDLLELVGGQGSTLLFVTHAIDEAILIGTRLHLLSAHPGRTIATFDTGHLGFMQLGSGEFEAMTADVHTLLFGRGQGDGTHV
jgi:NitT/TauT family transport system ATP-binding protein